ncbi:MAG: AMIN domain-containing protein [Gemmatimonadota bacterium]|nr:AMIN domain-containing protein [Gemmatimonadota bacterium]MDH3367500.1 AMIN domain-containing protein [Gemmatimonadota bacterium]MDH3479241.1 AMIN domain-containing protein [Gemmatimonadota bacterium]
MKRSMMLALVGLVLMAPPVFAGPGEVKAVSVLPGAGRAVVVIDVAGSVSVQDFTLDHPARLVIDVVGATLQASGILYDGRNRGGIVNIRSGQFRPDVVRIVLELESLRGYELEYVDDAIRISIGTDRTFAAWSSLAATDRVAPRVSPARAAANPAPRPPTPLQSQQTVVTASYDSATIAEVMEGFAALSGKTIVLGKDVSGHVTARIRNQPWDVAFQAILESQGLAAAENEYGIIRVATQQALSARDSLEPLTTKIMRVNYAKASALIPVLDGARSGRGKVVADTSTNSLVVTDVPSRVTNMEELVQNLDLQTPQVSIQAKIILVSRTDVMDLGIQYDFGDDGRSTFFNTVIARPDPTKGFDTNADGLQDAFQPYDPQLIPAVVNLGGDAIAGVANASQRLPATALDLLFTVALGRFSLTSWLQALESAQLADEQSEPVVTTADNRKAEIWVGERTPIRVVDVGAQAAAAASIQLVETGIRLAVTPHVTANRQVLLDIRAENSSVNVADTDLGVAFGTREATSQILVNDGQTAVIGGLTQTSVTTSRSGIPYLVDLPVIGNLFGVTRRREVRQDLLILVTPHILDVRAPGQ